MTRGRHFSGAVPAERTREVRCGNPATAATGRLDQFENLTVQGPGDSSDTRDQGDGECLQIDTFNTSAMLFRHHESGPHRLRETNH